MCAPTSGGDDIIAASGDLRLADRGDALHVVISSWLEIGRDLAVISVNRTAQARIFLPALSDFEGDLTFFGDEVGRPLW